MYTNILKYISKLAIVSLYVALTIIISIAAPTVHATAPHFTYIGIDAGASYCNLQQDYGSDIFQHKPMTQLSVFVGYQFAPLMAAELGYEQTFLQTGSTFVAPATSQFGVSNFTALASNSYDTKKKMHGYNFYYAPQIHLYENLFVTFMLGVEYVHTNAELLLTEFDGDAATTLEQEEYKLSFATHKIIPKLGLRLQYCIKEAFYLHLYSTWAQTSKINMYATRGIFPAQILNAKLKNTSSVGIGIIYKFRVC